MKSKGEQEKVIALQLTQLLVITILYIFFLPFENEVVRLYPLMTSALSVIARVAIVRSKYELRDKEGRKVPEWKISLYEQWSKGYRGVKVRELPDWFLPVHIALFTVMSVAYVLIASLIAGELIFLREQYAHLFIPLVIFYHFVTDFEGWKRILTNPKALLYSFAYSTAGVIFWFVMMQMGVFPSFRELFMVGK